MPGFSHSREAKRTFKRYIALGVHGFSHSSREAKRFLQEIQCARRCPAPHTPLGKGKGGPDRCPDTQPTEALRREVIDCPPKVTWRNSRDIAGETEELFEDSVKIDWNLSGSRPNPADQRGSGDYYEAQGNRRKLWRCWRKSRKIEEETEEGLWWCRWGRVKANRSEEKMDEAERKQNDGEKYKRKWMKL